MLRHGAALEPADGLLLERDDQVTIYGQIGRLITAGPKIGPEIYERVARDVGAQTVDVVVQRKEVAGRRLADLAMDVGHGVYINGMFHAGEAVPFGPETLLRAGDVLRVTGSR